MNEIVTFLQKLENPLDQALIGVVWTSKNVAAALKVIASIRALDLGPQTDAICDELTKLLGKVQVIVGSR